MTLCTAIVAACLMSATGADAEVLQFDFGPVDIQPPVDFQRVSPQSIFSVETGWGWRVRPGIRAFGPRGEEASPLLDGVETTSKATGEAPEFVVELANGRYVVSFLTRLCRPQEHHVQDWVVRLPYYRRPVWVWAEVVVDVTDGRLRFSAGRPGGAHWAANLLVVRPLKSGFEEPGIRQLLVTASPRNYDVLPAERVIIRHWPTATETDAGVTVDNGRLRVVIDRFGCGFLDEVWLDGEQIVSAPEGWRGAFADVIRLSPDATGVVGRNGLRGRLVPSMLNVDSVELVRRIWPVVVRITGRFINGEVMSGYQLEIHIPQHKPYVVVHHRYDLEINTDIEMLSSLGLSLPLNLDDEHPVFIETRLPSAGATGRGGERDRWRLKTGEPGTHWRIGGLMQWGPNYTWNWKASRHDCRPVKTSTGRRSEGWVELYDWKWGVRVGIPGNDLWTRAPKELVADGRDGSASVLFWSPRARPLDLRRGAKGRASILPGREAFHTAYLWFFRSGRARDPVIRDLINADLAEGVLE